LKRPLGPVIAKRRLASNSDAGTRVVVTLGKPRWNRREWECPFQIRGGGVSQVEFGYGLDSMQALTTALDGIRAVLDGTFGSLAWEGGLPDHSGFQRQIPVTFGRAFTRRLERLVERECSNHVRRLKKRRIKR